MKAAIHPSILKTILFAILSFILTIPLFIFVYHRLPDLEWSYKADKILAFLLIAVLLFFIFRSFKFVIVTAVVAIVGWLWYGSGTGRYGFKELYQGGKGGLYGMQNNLNTKIV